MYQEMLKLGSSFLQSAKAFWHLYRKNKLGVLGLSAISFFVMVAVLAPYISPYNPFEASSDMPYQPPTWSHLLGTNDIKQDIFSEIIYGTRVSLGIGLLAAVSACSIGAVVGLMSGYFGGNTDGFLMIATDIFLIIPTFPLMIVLTAYLGPDLLNVIFALSVTSWPSVARTVRSTVLSLRELTYVESSRAIGGSGSHIVFNHILPNVTNILAANVTIVAVKAIVTEAGLSFLGLGDPTQKSWGMILYHAQSSGAFLMGAWWWIIPPGLLISAVALSFTFVNHALDEVLNPKLKTR